MDNVIFKQLCKAGEQSACAAVKAFTTFQIMVWVSFILSVTCFILWCWRLWNDWRDGYTW
jgi:hypothetical protein